MSNAGTIELNHGDEMMVYIGISPFRRLRVRVELDGTVRLIVNNSGIYELTPRGEIKPLIVELQEN